MSSIFFVQYINSFYYGWHCSSPVCQQKIFWRSTVLQIIHYINNHTGKYTPHTGNHTGNYTPHTGNHTPYTGNCTPQTSKYTSHTDILC